MKIFTGNLIRYFYLAILPLLVSCASKSGPPNIIFVYPDDQRWDAISIVQKEQGSAARFPWLKTPGIDRLAERGVRFRNAFVVTSLCSPARATVLTGLYGHLHGVEDNRTPFPSGKQTFAHKLQDAGYRTGYYGKWHMDGQKDRPGFDEVASFVGQGRYYDCPLIINGEMTETKGWVDEVVTSHAIDFLNRQEQGRPFFLFLGFKSPHGPRNQESVPAAYREFYEGAMTRPVPNTAVLPVYAATKDTENKRGGGLSPATAEPRIDDGIIRYMRHITALDHCLSRLLDALDTSPHAGNTIVIFTSDNGFYLGEHRIGDKRSAYEESLRVPLIIRMPDDKGPMVNDDMVLNLDLAPTILSLAGIEPPAGMQGRSLAPLLEGKTPDDWRSSFFYEYIAEPHFNTPTVLATRTSDAKLILYPGYPEFSELFDLDADPYEVRNLYGDPAYDDLQRKLESEHQRLLQESGFEIRRSTHRLPVPRR